MGTRICVYVHNFQLDHAFMVVFASYCNINTLGSFLFVVQL